MSAVLPEPLLPPLIDLKRKKPPSLYVTHTAGAVNRDALDAGVALLCASGFDVSRDDRLGAPDAKGSTHGSDAPSPQACRPAYLAGHDDARLKDLMHALTAPDIDVVIAARGGYGTTRILPALTGVSCPSDRWIIGYSDITALHLWANQQGVATLHGPMVAGLGVRGAGPTLDGLLSALTAGPAPTTGLRRVSGEHGAKNGAPEEQDGSVEGTLIGGNLSLLCALFGTEVLPDVANKLVFIEEVGEPLYRIDRMLTELALRWADAPPAGVIFGQFTRCGPRPDTEHEDLADSDFGPQLAELIAERSAHFSCPVVAGLEVGHGAQSQSLVLGIPYVLDATGGTLSPCWSSSTAPSTTPSTTPSTASSTAAKPPARADTTARVLALLRRALNEGVCVGAQIDASICGERVISLGVGTTRRAPSGLGVHAGPIAAGVDSRTLFDIASVTKAVSTALLAWRAVEEGLVTLDTPVPGLTPASGHDSAGDRATLLDLLRHSSGLPSYDRVYPELRAHDATVEETRRYFQGIAAVAPRGVSAYSDPGYIRLGFWLEELFGASLDQLFAREIARPLGLTRTLFRPLRASSIGPARAALRPDEIAATEYCHYRGATLCGEVHDEHAQLLGGVAGHAGLFSTASEVSRIAESLLGYGPAILRSRTVEAMWGRDRRVGSFVAGWDTPSGPTSNAGSIMDREATVGHLGFTGTSLWIDRRRELVVTLLTNRVHPTRESDGIRWLRPALHDLICAYT